MKILHGRIKRQDSSPSRVRAKKAPLGTDVGEEPKCPFPPRPRARLLDLAPTPLLGRQRLDDQPTLKYPLRGIRFPLTHGD